MRRLNTSPVVESTWQKRHEASVARKSFFASLLIIVFLFLIYLDLTFSSISSYLEIDNWLCHAVEMIAGIILIIKIIFNSFSLISFIWTFIFGGPVDLTDGQRKLLGVEENEHGFRTPPRQQWHERRSPENSLIFSTSQGSFSGGDGSPHSMVRSLSPGFISPASTPTTQYQTAYTPTAYTPTMSPFSGRSFDMHHVSLNSSAPSPQYGRADGSFRMRHSFSTPHSTPTSPYDCIKDQNTLHSFLQEQAEKELRSKQAQETHNASSSSFWTYGASALDLTHTLRKYAYQLATHLPQSTTKASAADQAAIAGGQEVWSKYGVGEDDLYLWTEKLRKWISATIVSRLSKKIDGVNKQLLRIGCEDMQLGEVSVATLKQLALTKGGMVRSLNNLVPYLDFFANQEYLIRRIKDLSTGSMSDFRWNKGGDYGKPWAEHLITDASLVMQLLCTYLDSRLPAQPSYLDGKVFTAEHFVKTPDKPDMQRKDNLLFYQTSVNPPHFQVVIGTETFNLPKGRNNMFQAILLLFYHIKTKEQGMLGRVNLGMSGLNLLWIFD